MTSDCKLIWNILGVREEGRRDNGVQEAEVFGSEVCSEVLFGSSIRFGKLTDLVDSEK